VQSRQILRQSHDFLSGLDVIKYSGLSRRSDAQTHTHTKLAVLSFDCLEQMRSALEAVSGNVRTSTGWRDSLFHFSTSGKNLFSCYGLMRFVKIRGTVV
jgi:hypothetical protein